MSGKIRRENPLLLFAVAVYLHSFRACYSLSLWHQDITADRIKRDNDDYVRRTHLKSTELQPEVADLLPHFNVTEMGRNGFTFDKQTWTVGVSRRPRSSVSNSTDGEQADFTGFQGKVLGLSFDSSPQFSQLVAVRPLVLCEDDAMTFTTSGEIFTHLLLDRDGDPPISPLQLPAYCGYSAKMSWSDVTLMMPYDACYITQENGSYVLPVLWLGHPLKLLCPVQTPVPFLSPSVFCSSYGMAVQIDGQQPDILMMKVTMNGVWVPFVSDECGQLVSSNPGQFTLLIPYSAPCLIVKDGLQLHFLTDGQEYIFICPLLFPYTPFDHPFPEFPDPDSPVSTIHTRNSPQPHTQGEDAQFLGYSLYPGFHYLQLPQVYPPGSRFAHAPHSTPDSAPGPKPSLQQQLMQFVDLTGPEHILLLPEDHPEYPNFQHPFLVQSPSYPGLVPEDDGSSNQISSFPVGSFYYSPNMNYSYTPLQYHEVEAAPTPEHCSTSPPPATQPLEQAPHLYYFFLPYPELTTGPVTQAPTSPTTSPPPEQPADPEYPIVPVYVLPIYSPYYHFYPTPPPLIPTSESQKAEVPQVACPTNTENSCEYDSLYYPNPLYQLLYSVVPQAVATTPTSSAASSSTRATPMIPYFECLVANIAVFLPSAHPGSIEVREQIQPWQLLSDVSPHCDYKIMVAKDSGVVLHFPLPACYSEISNSTGLSLRLTYWNLSVGQYEVLELQCPRQTAQELPAPVTVAVLPTLPSTTHISPPVVLKPKVLCSSHQMTVEIPTGAISAIYVKDINGNQTKFRDIPKDCGYSVRRNKYGKIQMRFQLHLRCQMSVQDQMYIITVGYMTESERQESKFLCPALIPDSRKECHLPSPQRLPCGPVSVSKPQCLSKGCCFSSQPPTCYYPMDACTIDRHFVFSVPAAIVDPPLSPAMLLTLGNSTCKPEKVTSEYALFKIPMDECGAHKVVMGKTIIYMVEVISMVRTINLGYGTITRDSPFRLLVECRYLPDTVPSVNYMVKTPSLGSAVSGQGVFGAQLRIAKDAQYSSYYPQYHRPLHKLLGRPIYMEVRLLNNTDPTLVLLVHYCVAYPRSGNAVWILLYNGCPNPLDPALQQSVLLEPQPPSPQGHTRRFKISTFQFLEDNGLREQKEEVYFMCSTEICSTLDGPCIEGCFGLQRAWEDNNK